MSAESRRPERALARRGGGVELLRLPAFLFGVAAGVRGRLYDRGWLPVARLGVPVVCVGNLTAGGTGKTPMVAWVVRALAARGWRPGVASRGYRGQGPGASDEARELAQKLAGVPHEADPDRARAGRALVAGGCDVVVLDDGFQHRRLARDLDLVLVDATRPWGLPATGGEEPVRALLPRGLLRERPSALARADAIVVTRCDQAGADELAALERELEAAAPGRPLCRARHRPVRLRALSALPGALSALPSALAGRAVDLVSGVGNPDAFEATVRALGARPVEHRRFPDHHAFRAADLDGLGAEGRWIVTTAKDAARLDGASALPPGLFALEVDLVVDAGAVVLDALLGALRPGSARRERSALHEGLHG